MFPGRAVVSKDIKFRLVFHRQYQLQRCTNYWQFPWMLKYVQRLCHLQISRNNTLKEIVKTNAPGCIARKKYAPKGKKIPSGLKRGNFYKALDSFCLYFSLDSGRLGFLGLDSLQWVFRIKNGFQRMYRICAFLEWWFDLVLLIE